MDFILFIVFVVIVYFAMGWFAEKLIKWGSKQSAIVDGNDRMLDIAFFAVVGIVVTITQMIVWLVKGIEWVVHLLV